VRDQTPILKPMVYVIHLVSLDFGGLMRLFGLKDLFIHKLTLLTSTG
jgi:hypothetical protein